MDPQDKLDALDDFLWEELQWAKHEKDRLEIKGVQRAWARGYEVAMQLVQDFLRGRGKGKDQ